ncbi:unconventional myosin-XVIIIa-like [Bombus vosnesenskii]|uniref:Unconventional myosin-XVIIIa-like n=1 Tax=Bombus vosnesenskii TaxID=207650 RepID=A0A6J3LC53_9HYME|nr:unconventional myosin-XVIIIa-like [Bombus vosnesenskii]
MANVEDLEKLRTKELRARLASLGLKDFVRQERCAKSWAKLKRALRNEFENVVSAQQHEDDLEQLVGFKKQLEKKLADAYEEVEEQRQVVGQWKRRVQSLNGEMHDLRLLLEEQTARNNLLEKKQRKFDSETQNLMDDLRQEKAQRKRLAREKEIAIAEKFTIEQNLSAARLEIELKEERLRTLGQGLEELTFGSKTEEEVAQLKNQLEDAECARAVAVKAKQALEQELNETQASLQEALRQRSEAEDRVNVASRERTELLSQLEENKEELAEVLKKYRAAVQQVSEERRIVARHVVIDKVDQEMVSSSDSCGQKEDLANITRRKNLAKQQQQDVVDDICEFTEKDSVAEDVDDEDDDRIVEDTMNVKTFEKEEIIVSVDGKLLTSSMYEPSLRKCHDAVTTIKAPDKSEMGKQTAERKIEEERKRSSSIEDEQTVVFQEERDQLRADAKRRIEKIQAPDKWAYNKRRKKATAYRTGDLVAIERMQKGPGLKLHPKFLGPYRVIKVLRNDQYIVQREEEHKGPRTTSTAADHMKWWNADDSDTQTTLKVTTFNEPSDLKKEKVSTGDKSIQKVISPNLLQNVHDSLTVVHNLDSNGLSPFQDSNKVNVESTPTVRTSKSTVNKPSRGSVSSGNTSTMDVQHNVSTSNHLSYITSSAPPQIRSIPSDSHTPRRNVKTPPSLP